MKIIKFDRYLKKINKKIINYYSNNNMFNLYISDNIIYCNLLTNL